MAKVTELMRWSENVKPIGTPLEPQLLGTIYGHQWAHCGSDWGSGAQGMTGTQEVALSAAVGKVSESKSL